MNNKERDPLGMCKPVDRVLGRPAVGEEAIMAFRTRSSIAGLALAVLVFTGCGTVTGAVVGAGAGAAVGAATDVGVGKGALIGTGIGAVAGAIYDITQHEKD